MGLEHSEQDLPFENELLSEQELSVGLPFDNATIASLSIDALNNIRREHASRSSVTDDLETARRKLADIIRLPEYTVKGRLDPVLENPHNFELKHGVLNCGLWSIPIAAVIPAKGKAVRIILTGKPEDISKIPAGLEDTLIIYPEIFGIGEYCFDADYLMLIAGAGERALGIQAAQVLGLVEWAAVEYGIDKIGLESDSWNLSLVIVITAALKSERIEALFTGSFESLLTSLSELIEKSLYWTPDTAAMYCFGLLKEFDMQDLIFMSAPVKIYNNTRGHLRTKFKEK